VCGRAMSTISAPASRSHSAPRCQSASISGGMPSTRYSVGMPMRRPRRSPTRLASKSGTARGAEVESLGSWPDIAVSMIAASRTVAAIGPAWSSEEAKATMPQREQRP